MRNMKATSAALFLYLIYGALFPETHVTAQHEANSAVAQKDTGKEASFIFSKIEPTLHRTSRVPARLPSFLPGVDREHPIDAILISASSSGYEILLAMEPDCQGQNVCLYGSVFGSAAPIKLAGRSSGIPVKLRRGIQGRFIDAECHAYCNQSYVKWSEGGFYYAVGIKAEKKENMIRVANSAIPPLHKPQ